MEHYEASSRSDSTPPWKLSASVPIVLGLLTVMLVMLSCITTVGTKQVGVVTSFGRPVGTMTSGLHFKAPWQKVTEMDGTIQTDSYIGGGEKPECISVRIRTGSVACIDTTIRWQIVPDEADVLFQDYRTQGDVNDQIQNSLVKRELTAALNEVYGPYDPLASVTGGQNTQVDALSAQVHAAMERRVKDLGGGTTQVEILSVTNPLIRVDGPTQAMIDAFQREVGNTRVANQREETATADARANRAIAASIQDPNVLAYQCLNIMEEMAESEQGVPVGMYCFPGGNGPVLVPGGGGN